MKCRFSYFFNRSVYLFLSFNSRSVDSGIIGVLFGSYFNANVFNSINAALWFEGEEDGK